MSQRNERNLPQVPEGEPPNLYVTPLSAEEIINAPMKSATPPAEPDQNMLFGSPLNIAGLIGGYAIEGTNAQRNLAGYIRSQANQKDGRKFSKIDAKYAPITPFPPGLWDYRCSTCRFYNPPEEGSGQRGTCDVVGQEGDPWGGAGIHAQGWCSLWLPPDSREAGEWLREVLGTDWDENP